MTSGERILITRHSAYNLIVLTEDEVGLRTLRFGHDETCQSVVRPGDPEYLELPYANVLPACLAFMGAPRRILVVGLGGGTIPSFFHHQLPDAAIDVVEIDHVVVEIAKDYCGFREDERMQVHVEDGRDFIEKCRNTYDMIVLDGFDAHSIPHHLSTAEFLQAVREALTPEGAVVANVWGRRVNDRYDAMLRTYRQVFEDTYIFDVPEAGTKIFVALPRKQAMTREEVVRRSREIATNRGFSYDLASAIAGFKNSDDECLQGGAVLRDTDR